jgi:hypothetical protein
MLFQLTSRFKMEIEFISDEHKVSSNNFLDQYKVSSSTTYNCKNNQIRDVKNTGEEKQEYRLKYKSLIHSVLR